MVASNNGGVWPQVFGGQTQLAAVFVTAAGSVCAPQLVISCPLLNGHVHLALRFL